MRHFGPAPVRVVAAVRCDDTGALIGVRRNQMVAVELKPAVTAMRFVGHARYFRTVRMSRRDGLIGSETVAVTEAVLPIVAVALARPARIVAGFEIVEPESRGVEARSAAAGASAAASRHAATGRASTAAAGAAGWRRAAAAGFAAGRIVTATPDERDRDEPRHEKPRHAAQPLVSVPLR